MDLISRDLKYVWHPCSQMKDYETFAPLEIQHASGPYLHLRDGRKLIDAISSWWCKSFGHAEPRIQQAIKQQMERFEHIILANTTNETIIELSERLAQLATPLSKVMYASDGSCAVEIALKLSIQSQQLTGNRHKNRLMALANGYHGETCLALSVSDLGLFKKSYQSLLTPCEFITNIPYVNNVDDPLWNDCSEYWPTIEMQLQNNHDTLAAIIVEPILQGSGGMKIYSADFLKRLSTWCNQHHVYLILDEILTGLGRTGLPLACQHADIHADFICLSKGLTAGFLPMSAVITRNEIYELFYDDYATGKTFMHSHTHTGNALAAAAALATLKILQQDNTYDYVQRQLGPKLREGMQTIAEKTGKLTNVRQIGAVVAADLVNPNNLPRLGYAVYQRAIKLGALLRPLGNTLYWLPPLNTNLEMIDELQAITFNAIEQVIT